MSKRDESYVIDLCDLVLGLRAKRQHRFDFLRGDSGRSHPVDAYYEIGADRTVHDTTDGAGGFPSGAMRRGNLGVHTQGQPVEVG